MKNLFTKLQERLVNIVNGGVTNDLPTLEKISTRNANLVISLIIALSFIFMGIAIYGNLHIYLLILLCNGVGMFFSLHLIRRGWRESGKLLGWFSGGLLVFLNHDIFGQSRNSDLGFLVLAICPLAFFRRNSWLRYVMATVAFLLWMFIAQEPGHIFIQRIMNIEIFRPWMFETVCLFVLIVLFLHIQYQNECVSLEVEIKTQQLMRVSQMIALGEIAGDIAHEINNPLQHILSRSERIQFVAEKNLNAQPNLQSVAEDSLKIQQTVGRISKIIIGLRKFSRVADSEPDGEYPLEYLISETVDFCRECFRGKRVDLRTKGLPEVIVKCNLIEFSQVLLNLLNNAFDAVDEQTDPWIEITAELRDHKNVAILVTDSGKGIAPEIAENILDPFFTTKKVGKGTGLGLSVSNEIIKAHGGKLFYDSTCANTRFVVVLPIV